MMENKSPSMELDKKGWLDYLYYKIGKQFDFFICGTYIKDGEKHFTKWKTYLNSVAVIDPINKTDTWEQRNFFENINQRQILGNEIVLDIEEPEKLKPIIQKIKGWECFVFETGSRGYHIHIFFNRCMSEKEKENFVKLVDTDIQKCSEKNLIALEYQPHWKSGKLKRQVFRW